MKIQLEDINAFIKATPSLSGNAGKVLTVNPGETDVTWTSTSNYTDEMARDAIGSALVAGSGILITVNDASDTITLTHSKIGNDYRVGMFFTFTPTASEVLLMHTFTNSVIFADDFAGSVASIGTNPGSSWVANVAKNGSNVGTITVSSTGVVAFATTGTTVSFATGDVISITAPAVADGTIVNSTFTLLGTRTSA